MPFPRSSGLLLHPTSFPGPHGIGDLGGAAYAFVDFLAASGQQLWQVLPLSPTGYGNSPYMCYSSMAGNPLLISLDLLVDEGWLTHDDLSVLPDFPSDKVDYDRVIATKTPLLDRAAERFKAHASSLQRQEFDVFCHARAFWLDDFAFFMALKQAHGGESWHRWDEAIAKRDPDTLSRWRKQLANDIYHHKFLQFEFFRQWSHLKQYANDRQIQIIGDMPIYVAHDSADVWSLPHIFHLDPETGEPALMAGVPPDYFSETGQLWGNPIYNWEAMQAWGFKWWLQRLQSMLEYVDLIRIDHFRGFQAYWEVPQGETTAMNGQWVEAPGREFFKTVKEELGSLPILAEDLGVITPEVEALRDEFNFPGMKILHFAFGSGPGNPYLPFNFDRNCMVYTGTHDNNTTVGWFESLSDWEKDHISHYLGDISYDGIHWDMIRLALSSHANQAVIPFQDLLGLGEDARMNLPGASTGNWEWRYRDEAVNPELAGRMHMLTEMYGRLPHPPAPEDETDG
ncbi:MAG: 4-alpha-glucanotransferase [Synechococcales cyanobacterium K44_A2020_017]|nr:4-alpha-glucanotransferase [Synechococcales cyanobacterium K32_A2020_035]MBF2096096.1 4-alpha-glucanotransferase [Synechococcales cyanobacterium K44_A2020_017]